MSKIKVTYDMMEEFTIKKEFQRYDHSTLTQCFLTMKNGVIIVGQSACVDPECFDQQLGKELAEQAAYDNCWQLFGFQLASEMREFTLLEEK